MKCAGLPSQSPAPSDRREYIHKQMEMQGEGKDARPLVSMHIWHQECYRVYNTQ